MKTIAQDILKIERGLICHQVNVLGYMGEGLALAIKNKWPSVYAEYKEHIIRTERVRMGDVVFAQAERTAHVANLFAQDRIWGDFNKTNYAVYPRMLQRINKYSRIMDLPIYMPHGIGCGLAGGHWETMKRILEDNCPEAIICQLP